jgi:hypothetical protein
MEWLGGASGSSSSWFGWGGSLPRGSPQRLAKACNDAVLPAPTFSVRLLIELNKFVNVATMSQTNYIIEYFSEQVQ